MESQNDNSMECIAGDSCNKETAARGGPNHDAAAQKNGNQEIWFQAVNLAPAKNEHAKPEEKLNSGLGLGSGEPAVKANETANVAGVSKPKRARRPRKDFEVVFREIHPRASKSKALLALKTKKKYRKKLEGARKPRKPRAVKLHGVQKRRKKVGTHFYHKKRKSTQSKSSQPKTPRPGTSRSTSGSSGTSKASGASADSPSSAFGETLNSISSSSSLTL